MAVLKYVYLVKVTLAAFLCFTYHLLLHLIYPNRRGCCFLKEKKTEEARLLEG